MLETLTILSVLAVHRPFYILICVSTLPTRHTTYIYNDSSNTIDDGECSRLFGNSTAVKVILMFIAPLNSFRFLEMNLLNALVTSLFTAGHNSGIETGSVHTILYYRN